MLRACFLQCKLIMTKARLKEYASENKKQDINGVVTIKNRWSTEF